MEKNGKRLHGGMRTEANGGEQRHGRPGRARRHGCPGRARRHGCPGRARRAHRPGARGCAGGPAISSALFQRRPGVQERAADGFTASPASTRCAQAGRTGGAGQERRAACEGKGERTARCVRPRRNRAGRAGARSSWLYSFLHLDAMHRPGAQGVRGGRTGRACEGKGERTARCVRPRRNRAGRAGARSSWLYSFPRLDAMRTGRARGDALAGRRFRARCFNAGRACRSAQQLALQLPPPRRDAHRPGAQGAQGKKGARRARGKAKERRDASARAGTGPGVQERAAAGFTAFPASTRCAQAGRTGRARRAHRPGARGERRKNGAMRPPAQEQGRIQRAAAGNKAARNRRNRRGRDARTGVGCAEGKAGRKSKERCGGSSRAQEQGE